MASVCLEKKIPKCGYRPNEIEALRIVDGEEAVPHSWPWMVSVLKEDDNAEAFMHFCGGTIVARNKVLTAAHCFKGVAIDDPLKVRLGVHDRMITTGDEIEVDVKRRDIHEKFDPVLKLNDIALLTLSYPINYTEQISPVCMGLKGQLSTNSTCYVTGWGHTQFLGSFSSFLQQLKLPILDDSICPNVTTKINVTIQFCAGYPAGGKDSCQGDSGGPVVCQDHDSKEFEKQWRQHGIVSYGTQCAKKGYAGVYTRIGAFRRWLADHIND